MKNEVFKLENIQKKTRKEIICDALSQLIPLLEGKNREVIALRIKDIIEVINDDLMVISELNIIISKVNFNELKDNLTHIRNEMIGNISCKQLIYQEEQRYEDIINRKD